MNIGKYDGLVTLEIIECTPVRYFRALKMKY